MRRFSWRFIESIKQSLGIHFFVSFYFRLLRLSFVSLMNFLSSVPPTPQTPKIILIVKFNWAIYIYRWRFFFACQVVYNTFLPGIKNICTPRTVKSWIRHCVLRIMDHSHLLYFIYNLGAFFFYFKLFHLLAYILRL